MALNIVFAPELELTYRIEGDDKCLTCETDPSILDGLVNWILTNAKIQVDGEQSTQQIQGWADDEAGRSFRLQVAVNGTIFLQYPSGGPFEPDCDAFLAALGDLNAEPSCLSIEVVAVENADNGSIESKTTILVKRDGLIGPFVSEGPCNGQILCSQPDCPEEPFEVASPYNIEYLVLDADGNENQKTVLQFTTDCNEPMTIECSIADTNELDCEGSGDEHNIVCTEFTFKYTATGVDSGISLMATVTFSVIDGGPCFDDQPPNMCDPPVISKTPEAKILEIAEEGKALLLDPARGNARNGCGQHNVKVEDCSIVRLCTKCCRGEFSYKITYTLEDPCGNEVTVDQFVRISDGEWDKYFSNDCPCECPPVLIL